MDTILLVIIMVLIGITVWLSISVNAETTKIHLRGSLSPELFVEILPPPLFVTGTTAPKPKRLVGSSKLMNSPKTAIVSYLGTITLPRKVYEGDSLNVSLVLKPSKLINPDAEMLSIQDSRTGKEIALLISKESNQEQFLEVELIAAGFMTDGSKKQRQPLSVRALNYYWNCYFPNSGTHTLSLIMRVADPTSAIEIGIIPHRFKVVKVDHMTYRQVWILTVFAGLISGALALLEALHRLGLW